MNNYNLYAWAVEYSPSSSLTRCFIEQNQQAIECFDFAIRAIFIWHKRTPGPCESMSIQQSKKKILSIYLVFIIPRPRAYCLFESMNARARICMPWVCVQCRRKYFSCHLCRYYNFNNKNRLILPNHIEHCEAVEIGQLSTFFGLIIRDCRRSQSG